MSGKRGSGRTLRMLAEAARLAEGGRRVHVVGTAAQLSVFRGVLLQAGEGSASFVLVASSSPDFDVVRCSVRGVRDEDVLVDHHVLESRLSRALAMMTRFDLPGGNS